MDYFKRLSSITNLLHAYTRVRLGKRSKPIALVYDYYLEENLGKLSFLLQTKKYTPNPYVYFVITDPKTRHIAAPHFRDRIVHRALVNQIEPYLDKKFIYDSYACRKNKGTHFGLTRVKKFLMATRSIYGREQPVYFLKCDVQKYFQNISWDILISILEEQIKDPETMELIKTIITNHKVYKVRGKIKNLPDQVVSIANRVGIPIGNLTSQLFANVYLNELDQYVKHTLKERWYARYMDDFLIIHPDKKHLVKIRNEIRVFLANRLKLTLHPRKVAIQRVTHGVPFVGYRIFYDHIVVRAKTVQRFQKRLHKRKRMVQEGVFAQKELKAMCDSFVGHLKHANSYGLQKFLFHKPNKDDSKKVSKPAKFMQLPLPF